MTDDQSKPPTPFNPFAKPGATPIDMRNAPTRHPFEGPPEPARSVPEAMLEVGRRAYGEWREYLPHGLSLADYEPYRSGWLRDRAITSATKPLQTALRPDEVADAAQAAADAAFVCTSRLLSQYEPD